MTGALDVAHIRFKILCDEWKSRTGASEAELARQMGYKPQKLGKLLSRQIRIGLGEAQNITHFFDVSIAWLTGESEIRQKLSPEIQSIVQNILNALHHKENG